ncbi:hypothetical protein SDC9_149749 [bioreactor metagenome]|uniref:DUF3408 domain-containing protein n=1 Tax=bioreactor metagenome TaxID=1076179 RepID=A0A645EPS1_9ZZZZ
MSKRKQVDVDEELIKSMMTGDIPRLNREPVEAMLIPEEDAEVESPAIENTAYNHTERDVSSPPKSSQRRDPKDYTSLFLQKNAGTKRQTYVSSDLYDKISKILGIIAKDISVPNFIDNVLENHLKEYRDEINEIYRNNADLLL